MSVQKYLQMREKWLKFFVKFLNPDAVVVVDCENTFWIDIFQQFDQLLFSTLTRSCRW